MMQRIPLRTFSIHYRKKFGCAIGKIPLNLGEICPNRAKGGCIYCHAPAFTPKYLMREGGVEVQIRRGKKHLLKNRFSLYFAYFQQETSTSPPLDQLLPVFSKVLQDQDCVGLIVSTRPDYLHSDLLDKLARLLRKTHKDCVFELGVQSVHDRSLVLLNRNHTFADCVRVLKMISGFDCFEAGAHLLFGIPGESEEDMVETVQRVCDLGIDCLKFHQLQVLKNTPLQRIFEQGGCKPFSMDEYFEFLMRIIPLIPKKVVLHRLWATAHPEVLIAPKWGVLATELGRTLREKMAERNIWQGKYCR